MNNIEFDILGFVIGSAGLALCRIAQITIGNSWRVGIDEYAKPGLITHGIYSIIRNPTYTGLFMLCMGVIVINPTILFSWWVLAFVLTIEFQVRCEEEYLESIYGSEYSHYRKNTYRYIPYLY